MELKIFKHLYRRLRNIEGKVIGEEYTYTVAIKRGWRWYHLFFRCGTCLPELRASEILQERRVSFQARTSNCRATHFPKYGDAVVVMNDILNNPDKYIQIDKSGK